MQQNQLDRVLRLVRRTGDRLVVADSASDEVFAVMRLDEYENLLDAGEPVENLTEKEMFSKVNHDIASWRARHQAEIESLFDEDDEDEIYDEEEEIIPEKKTIDDDVADFVPSPAPIEDIEIPADIDEDIASDFSEPKEILPEKVSSPEPEIIPLPTPQTEQSIPAPAAEVSLHDVPEDEEEKFYLEPVE